MSFSVQYTGTEYALAIKVFSAQGYSYSPKYIGIRPRTGLLEQALLQSSKNSRSRTSTRISNHSAV
jgi:hypothetical protein